MKIMTRPLVDGMILCKELGQDLFVLNESSRLLWQAHAAGMAEEALPQVLVEHYGISLEVARQDCARALAEWRAAGLLEEPGKGTLLAGVLAGMLLRLEVEDEGLAQILRSLFLPLLDGVARRVEANQALELRLKGTGEAIYL